MELVNVREIFKNTIRYENQQVTIGGWVRSNRNSKNFGFIVVNDGTFFEPIQVVYGDGLENYEEVCKINVGAAVIVKGQLVPTPEAKQPFEIQAAEVTVEGASTPDYPLQKKRHTFEYLRTISHLRPRTNTFEAVYVPCVHMRFTNFSRSAISFMCILRSSQEVTARVQGKCSR